LRLLIKIKAAWALICTAHKLTKLLVARTA
jgi:hypothetical protein